MNGDRIGRLEARVSDLEAALMLIEQVAEQETEPNGKVIFHPLTEHETVRIWRAAQRALRMKPGAEGGWVRGGR